MYNLSHNIDTVLKNIQEFQDLCTLLNNPKTDTQLVTYAYLVLQKTGVIIQSLKEWNNQSVTLKVFENFQKCTRSQYYELKATRGLPINNITLNMIQEIKNHQGDTNHNTKEEICADILDSMQTIQHQIQALNTGMYNKENMNPNGYCLPVYTPEQWQEAPLFPFHAVEQQINCL